MADNVFEDPKIKVDDGMEPSKDLKAMKPTSIGSKKKS
jgi:hypothetical protein